MQEHEHGACALTPRACILLAGSCAFVTFEHHVSALAATKMGGVHRMNQNDRPIVVRFADSQGGKRQRVG